MTETSKLIQGRTGPWEIVMGLEIHAQVASRAKLFSGAAVGFGLRRRPAAGQQQRRQPALLDLGPSAAQGQQIEGDSIRCPYHGWRYNSAGDVDDIPYFDGPCPKSASIRSYPVVDNMGCVMAWFDPDGRAPDYDPPFLPQWDDPQWVN